MQPIRVLIVDDSHQLRLVFTGGPPSEPRIQVVDLVRSASAAMSKLRELSPDLVVLGTDAEDPSGLETVAALRKDHPRVPVIMVSPLTQRGAAFTLEALALGATDYVTRPTDVGGEALVAKLREELLPKVLAICAGRRSRPSSSGLAAARGGHAAPAAGAGHVDVVAVGVSTGGPQALEGLLPLLPRDFPVPVLVVQHMPPVFTPLLAQRLASRSQVRVAEAVDGAALAPGHAWIAPGDRHMVVARGARAERIRLHQGPPENSCRPSVDVLFRSVAEVYGERALALVLTGMGQDGLRGCERIKQAGGRVIVQDRVSSVMWGMPGQVAKAGLADLVVPLEDMAEEVVRTVQGGARSSGNTTADA